MMKHKIHFRRVTTTVATLVAILLVANFAYACDSCAAHADKKSDHVCTDKCDHGHEKAHVCTDDCQHGDMKKHVCDGNCNHAMGALDADGKAKGATMGAVFHADKLYTCSMHKHVITDNKEAKCPQCSMALTALSKEDQNKLVNSHPIGCMIDPVVVNGKSKDHNCALCGMKLIEVKHDQHDMHAKMGKNPS